MRSMNNRITYNQYLLTWNELDYTSYLIWTINYKQIRGTIHQQQHVCFTPTTSSDSPSSILLPPTPYPRSRPSSSPTPCLVALQCSPTASQYSPTASWYNTPPESPVFIPEVLFPNPDCPPTFNGQDLLEQIQEMSTNEVKSCWCIERQIEVQMQSLNRIWVDWVNYQGGIGTRFNPIIIEDDWNQGFQV